MSGSNSLRKTSASKGIGLPTWIFSFAVVQNGKANLIRPVHALYLVARLSSVEIDLAGGFIVIMVEGQGVRISVLAA